MARWARVISAVVAAVVVAAVVADVVAGSWVESQLASRARSATGAGSSSAQVGTFPFLYRLLATGSVPRVDVELGEVPAGPLRLSSVHVSLRRVRVSRHALVMDRRVQVVGVARGTVTVTVTAADLSAGLHRPVRILADGRVTATVAGLVVQLQPSVAPGNVVVLRLGASSASGAGGITLPSLRVRLPSSTAPCAVALAVVAGAVRLSCTLDRVPPALLLEASRAAASQA